MLRRAFGEIKEHKLSFVLSLILVMSFGTAILLTTSKASAGANDPSNRVVFVTNAVEFEIGQPLQVTLVWVGDQIDPQQRKVYPGQEIAIGEVKIENQSPIRYGVFLRPEPLVPGDKSWPQLTLLYLLNGVEYQQYAPFVMEPNTTVRVQVKVFVDWGAQPTSFRGLNLVVELGPPPAETVTECPANTQCA